MFNRIPAEGKTEEFPLSKFYSTTITVIQRLCADEEKARLVVTHDLTLKPGEMSNIFGKKTLQISGEFFLRFEIGLTG